MKATYSKEKCCVQTREERLDEIPVLFFYKFHMWKQQSRYEVPTQSRMAACSWTPRYRRYGCLDAPMVDEGLGEQQYEGTVANYRCGCLGMHRWSAKSFLSCKTLFAKGVSLLSTSDGRKSVDAVGGWVLVIAKSCERAHTEKCTVRAHNPHSLDSRPQSFNQTTGSRGACLRRARTSRRRKRRGSKSLDRRL
jgi:hypothetical protein